MGALRKSAKEEAGVQSTKKAAELITFLPQSADKKPSDSAGSKTLDRATTSTTQTTPGHNTDEDGTANVTATGRVNGR
jgi:hypothetical protein